MMFISGQDYFVKLKLLLLLGDVRTEDDGARLGRILLHKVKCRILVLWLLSHVGIICLGTPGDAKVLN